MRAVECLHMFSPRARNLKLSLENICSCFLSCEHSRSLYSYLIRASIVSQELLPVFFKLLFNVMGRTWVQLSLALRNLLSGHAGKLSLAQGVIDGFLCQYPSAVLLL